MRRAKSAADTARDAAFVECTVVEVRTGYQINAAKARSASYLPNVLARWPTHGFRRRILGGTGVLATIGATRMTFGTS